MKRKNKPKKHTSTHEKSCFQPTRCFFCLLSFPAQQTLPDWLYSCYGESLELVQEHCREEPWPVPAQSPSYVILS